MSTTKTKIVNNFSLAPLTAGLSFAQTTQTMATTGLTAQEVTIFQRIHDAIFQQRLPPATRLTELELSEVFGVSRMRVRRVLLALAHTGVIALPRGRGAQVASPSAEEARAVFAARRLIETAVLAQAPPPEPATVEKLRQLIEHEAAANEAQDRAASIHLSGGFHVELANCCANPVVAEIVAGLVTRSSLVIALFQRSGHLCCRPDDHTQLLEALVQSNNARAIDLMRTHLTDIESGLDLTAKPPATPNLQHILSP